jgi:hypothetical protein
MPIDVSIFTFFPTDLILHKGNLCPPSRPSSRSRLTDEVIGQDGQIDPL